MAAEVNGGEETTSMKSECETIGLSWAFGADYKFAEHVGVSAHYNLGLSNIAKTTSSEEGKLKSNVIQTGLSFPLGSSGSTK